MNNAPIPSLDFTQLTPIASHSLGGLPQDHFCNGRLYATVAAHGGLTDVSFWGQQHLGAPHFFRGETTTAWNKLFRTSLVIGGKRYYPVLNQSRIYPFGIASQGEAGGVSYRYDLLLLKETLVQRFEITSNPENLEIGLEILHQEAVTAVRNPSREWRDFAFHAAHNALVTACTDTKTPGKTTSLAQQGFDVDSRDLTCRTTWIAISSDLPLSASRGHEPRSKHYLKNTGGGKTRLSCYMTFATDEAALHQRLGELAANVHSECDELLRQYETRLENRPRIRSGSPVLDSAFSQYPAIVDVMSLSDRPGAVRATTSGYFVWGWDGMMSLFCYPLANDLAHAAEVLRFFHETWDPQIGLPHAFTTDFQAFLKGPVPSHAQYLAGLYLYIAHGGDLEVARKVWPTCLAFLEKCRQGEVRGTGLVVGNALWPDFPEAMEETGDDISAINNSMLYQGLRSVECLAALLGDHALSLDCARWAKRLRQNFIQYLFDEEKGFFISSCASADMAPRKHYCAQAVFWLTPFASELVTHAPRRITTFLDQHLRSSKCLLTLPHWDTAWMADGNQLGSSFPAADSFYLGAHRLVGDAFGLEAWLGDVEWFWNHLTAPEAFTPEAENEHAFGPDNTGCKQLQALATWYAGAFHGLAGMEFDHEGITITPWGTRPVEIQGITVRGITLEIKITGQGNHLGSLSLNGRPLSTALRKISWQELSDSKIRLEWNRTDAIPEHPVIVRADGLRVVLNACEPHCLAATVTGLVSGEVLVQGEAGLQIQLNGTAAETIFDEELSVHRVPIAPGESRLEIRKPA